MRSTLSIGPVVVALAAVAALSACSSTDPSTGSADITEAPATKATTKSPEPTGPKTSFGPGKYKVGTDIAPGSYSTAGPADSSIPNCYWARERNNSGDFSAIITNANPQGPTSVTVNTGEYFETQAVSRDLHTRAMEPLYVPPGHMSSRQVAATLGGVRQFVARGHLQLTGGSPRQPRYDTDQVRGLRADLEAA
jgi:hypothetical protein